MLSARRKFAYHATRRSLRPLRRGFRPLLECLEDRVVPTFNYGTPFTLPGNSSSFDPQGVIAADFNNDVALGSGMQVQPGNILVLTGQGNGPFIPAGNQMSVGDSSNNFIRSLTAVDLDGDKEPEIITANFRNLSVTVFQNTTSAPGA